jgi:hypothetical protein
MSCRHDDASQSAAIRPASGLMRSEAASNQLNEDFKSPRHSPNRSL